jgi:broad specificity phosphatase PhoE
VQFERIVSSDLRRAARTAELLADGLGVGAVSTEPQLREFDVGDWSGLTRPEIEERWPGQLDAWWRGALPRTPGGELRSAFADRIVAAVRGLAEGDGDVLAVAHGGVVGALQVATGVDGDRPRITNLSGRWFGIDEHDRLVPGNLVYLLDADESTASPTR